MSGENKKQKLPTIFHDLAGDGYLTVQVGDFKVVIMQKGGSLSLYPSWNPYLVQKFNFKSWEFYKALRAAEKLVTEKYDDENNINL